MYLFGQRNTVLGLTLPNSSADLAFRTMLKMQKVVKIFPYGSVTFAMTGKCVDGRRRLYFPSLSCV